ncbi:MAG: hypothetical protein ACP5OZ_00915 [Candidatus Woesearchaeota archaeon]
MIAVINFTKICAEKKSVKIQKLNINNNIKILSVEEAEIEVKPGNSALKIGFEFESNYEPEIANLKITGEAIDIEDKKNAKTILNDWSKNKRIPETFLTDIMNVILSKCNVEAILLSKELNLPPPLPMPKVGVKKNQENNYIG